MTKLRTRVRQTKANADDEKRKDVLKKKSTKENKVIVKHRKIPERKERTALRNQTSGLTKQM